MEGDVTKYGRELSQANQLLNGEYGAWRSIDYIRSREISR